FPVPLADDHAAPVSVPTRRSSDLSAGGGPFDRSSQLFLCEFDVEEGEDEGVPAGEVRVGELLQEREDRLEYVYDYGDDWELRIRSEEHTSELQSRFDLVCRLLLEK